MVGFGHFASYACGIMSRMIEFYFCFFSFAAAVYSAMRRLSMYFYAPFSLLSLFLYFMSNFLCWVGWMVGWLDDGTARHGTHYMRWAWHGTAWHGTVSSVSPYRMASIARCRPHPTTTTTTMTYDALNAHVRVHAHTRAGRRPAEALCGALDGCRSFGGGAS